MRITVEQLRPLAVLSAILLLSLLTWNSAGYFHTGQTWEEDSLNYIVGKNFADLGFWRTLLLDDCAAGADPAAHPMLYTHFPNISGVLQGLLQAVGVKEIHFIKLFYLPLFAAGMVYYYLALRRLFTEKIALYALAVTGTNYLGVISWADHTLHSLHWLVLFGAIFHYLCIPKDGGPGLRRHVHLFMAWFFIFLSGSVTLIHGVFLCAAIGLFYLFDVHRVRPWHAIILSSAVPALLTLHSLRIIYLLGYDAWFLDLYYNIKKSSDLADFKQIADFYAAHNIVVWGSQFKSLSFRQTFGIFYERLISKEGILGVYLLSGLLTYAALHALVKAVRDFTVPAVSGVEKFGLKVVILFAASILWNFIFPAHAANYFIATPYILLAGMINLSWAVLLAVVVSSIVESSTKSSRAWFRACLAVALLCAAALSNQRFNTFFQNPVAPIPAEEALHKYKGKRFYSNIWPYYVSYFTGEWAAGGVTADQAIRRDISQGAILLQKDRANIEKYSAPDYYLYVFSSHYAPVGGKNDKDLLDKALETVECGNLWCIYRL